MTAQLVAQFNQLQSSIVAVQDAVREHTKGYGIVSGETVADGLVELTGIVEKPEPALAPTTLAVAGRYVLTAAIFDELENVSRGVGGEIQLTDGIASLMRKEKVYAYRYEGVRYDCGSKLGFLQATVDLGEHHHEVGDEFKSWLSARF